MSILTVNMYLYYLNSYSCTGNDRISNDTRKPKPSDFV